CCFKHKRSGSTRGPGVGAFQDGQDRTRVVIDGRLSWSFDQDKIAAEKLSAVTLSVPSCPRRRWPPPKWLPPTKSLAWSRRPSAISRPCSSKCDPSTTRLMIGSKQRLPLHACLLPAMASLAAA